MQKLFRLPDGTWAASSIIRIDLDSLPPRHRVKRIDLVFDLSGTKTSTDTLDGNLFPLAVSRLTIGNLVNVPGWGLWQLNKQIYGRVPWDPTDVPGTGTTFDMEFGLSIPFHDWRQGGSLDGVMPCEALQAQSLEIEFAAAAVHGVGTLAITAGTVRVAAELVHGSGVPQINQIGYEDPGAVDFEIKRGVYKDYFLLDGTSSGTVTRAEITSVDLIADGDPIMSNVRHEQIVDSYNRDCMRDSAAELAQNAAERLPLIWHDQSGKSNISKNVAIEKAANVRLTGSITAPRAIYWRALPKDEATIARMVEATGVDMTDRVYEPQTATKTMPRAMDRSARLNRWTKKARLLFNTLPGKARQTPTV